MALSYLRDRLHCFWHGHDWLTVHDIETRRVYLVCRTCLVETRGLRLPTEKEIRCRL